MNLLTIETIERRIFLIRGHGLVVSLFLLGPPLQAAVIEEVTRLYPVVVERVARPRTVEEVRRLIKTHPGPVSIGGGRFSMGGQTATEGALQIDMREMNRVLSVDPDKRILRVEAGATWRQIQEKLDPLDLSVKIMQSYANFTVGGALSVNAHGRYVNQGPVIRSVRGIKLVLADGAVVEASPDKNRELFYGAIGGYGGLGVIVEAALELDKNEPLERSVARMPLEDYLAWFKREIKGSRTAVFHNADIYPPDYTSVAAITYSRTDKPVTVASRLQPPYKPTLRDRLLMLWLSERQYAKRLREKILDPMTLRRPHVVWRNYEASYDVATLEPFTRKHSTYVLQEYFIPVERLGDFVPLMREILMRHEANVLNVSIRHAEKDPGSLLAWARKECFAFVIYYKQGSSEHERSAVAVWTRELINAAIDAGGTYYLPYQWHATDEQFHRAYPRAKEFFALKRRVDPAYKLRNKLWDRYLPPPTVNEDVHAKLTARKDWKRAESQTFYVLPEWDIVRGADEAAQVMKSGRPSRFAYFGSIRRFWNVRRSALREARSYPRNSEYATVINVIGACYTVEHGLKGLYEKTVGRLFERSQPTAADLALQVFAERYGAFLHDTPWYEFPFGTALRDFRAASADGPWSPRKMERRLYGSLMIAAMGAWAKVIKKATGAAYDTQDLTLRAWVRGGKVPPEGRLIEKLSPQDSLIELPRYRRFQAAAATFIASGGRFIEISGNRRIALTALAPEGWDGARLWDGELGSWPVLSRPGQRRYALAVPVSQLHLAFSEIPASGATIEHVYDY